MGRFLLRRLRQFFWLSLGLGALAIFTNFKPSGLTKNPREYLMHGPNGSEPQVAVKKVEYLAPGALPESRDPGGINSNLPLLSETGKSMIWKGRRFVLIHNKWEPKSSDDAYVIDGQRTFFKDSGRFALPEKSGPSVTDLQQAMDDLKAANGDRMARAQEMLKSISENPLSAYSPEMIKKLGQAISDAKASINDRDKALKELSK